MSSAQVSPRAPEDNLRGRRVLVVDDDRALRFHARHVLEAMGLEVLEAGDGEQAVLALSDTPADLVLMDVRMPGLDGFEICRALRRLCADPELPIVMVSGMDRRVASVLAHEAGATAFAPKPVDWPALEVRIAALLGSREGGPG